MMPNMATTLAAIRKLESNDNYLATKTYASGKRGLGGQALRAWRRAKYWPPR